MAAMGPIDCEKCEQFLSEYRDAAATLTEASRALSQDLSTRQLELIEMSWSDVVAANRECDRIQKELHEHLKSHDKNVSG